MGDRATGAVPRRTSRVSRSRTQSANAQTQARTLAEDTTRRRAAATRVRGGGHSPSRRAPGPLDGVARNGGHVGPAEDRAGPRARRGGFRWAGPRATARRDSSGRRRPDARLAPPSRLRRRRPRLRRRSPNRPSPPRTRTPPPREASADGVQFEPSFVETRRPVPCRRRSSSGDGGVENREHRPCGRAPGERPVRAVIGRTVHAVLKRRPRRPSTRDRGRASRQMAGVAVPGGDQFAPPSVVR